MKGGERRARSGDVRAGRGKVMSTRGCWVGIGAEEMYAVYRREKKRASDVIDG
jgi:hypothetical protein